MSRQSEKREMTFDFDGLIQLLAGHLYSEKKVFIREMIQNAHDAIQRRILFDQQFDRDHGRIDIVTDLISNPAKIVFRDNGVGMTSQDLETFLSTIGRSGTRAAREAETEHELDDTIGQFGIGFLSGFVVGAKVEVKTRHYSVSPSEGCLWVNSGQVDYTVEPIELKNVGTEVTIYLRSAEDRGLLQEDAVKKVIRDYADMLRVPIHLNDERHLLPSVNVRVMPWERTGVSAEEMRMDAMLYLERSVPDSVLEAIPVKLHDRPVDNEPGIYAEGLLYITRTRVLAREVPRTVRVFLKRMFLCEDAKELLPPWATFVNGIINTSSLLPNAARDNFTRDQSFARLRDRLGEVIIEHFEHLKEDQPDRLSQILAYHNFGIKGACFYYEPFFKKFSHLLRWRVNSQSTVAKQSRRSSERVARSIDSDSSHEWATLPDVLASLPYPTGGGPKRLACFTTTSSANQFFEMADAAGTVVVDATYTFEDELLRLWADQHRSEVSLVYVDREDDPAVFREADPEKDPNIATLAREMSACIRPGGTGRLRVEARRFEPATLTAVLKTTEATGGAFKARSIFEDPNSTSDLRKMAEEMLRLSRNVDMRMSINASNPLIRTLANLVATIDSDPDLNDLMLGIYNDAILYNQELMTPRNAQLFHEQFQRLMGRSVEFVKQKSELAREREEVERLRVALQPKAESAKSRDRNHLVAFLMTPFNDDFSTVREAVRIVIEDHLGCELRLASDKVFDELIKRSVEAHMDDADFFIADVTGANPNVMMEVGAAFASSRGRPVVLIALEDKGTHKPLLPADLEGFIAVTYPENQSADGLAQLLLDGFHKFARLDAVLKATRKDRFISAEALRKWTRGWLPNSTYDRLSARFPTVSAWKVVSQDELESELGSERDLAAPVLKNIRENIPK